MTFTTITRFTRREDIPQGVASSRDNRREMVHGQAVYLPVTVDTAMVEQVFHDPPLAYRKVVAGRGTFFGIPLCNFGLHFLGMCTAVSQEFLRILLAILSLILPELLTVLGSIATKIGQDARAVFLVIPTIFLKDLLPIFFSIRLVSHGDLVTMREVIGFIFFSQMALMELVIHLFRCQLFVTTFLIACRILRQQRGMIFPVIGSLFGEKSRSMLGMIGALIGFACFGVFEGHRVNLLSGCPVSGVCGNQHRYWGSGRDSLAAQMKYSTTRIIPNLKLANLWN